MGALTKEVRREKRIYTMLTATEDKVIRTAAGEAGAQSVSSWIRDVALRAAGDVLEVVRFELPRERAAALRAELIREVSHGKQGEKRVASGAH